MYCTGGLLGVVYIILVLGFASFIVLPCPEEIIGYFQKQGKGQAGRRGAEGKDNKELNN